MKKVLSLTLLVLLTLTLILTGCKGQKKIDRIDVGDTLPRQYEQGSTPDFSGVVASIIYNDSSSISVDASQLSFGQLDTSKVGKTTLKITYGDFTQDFVVEIVKKASDGPTRSIVKIEYVSGIPATVFVGDTFHYESINIKAVYSDNTEEIISLGKNAGVKYTTIDLNTAGTQTITFTYMNLTCQTEVNVQTIKVTKIEVNYGSIADGIDKDTIEVTKYFNNGETARVNASDLSITQNGDIYTITYHDAKDGDFSVSIDSSVTPVLEYLEITKTGYEHTALLVGDTFSTAGVTCNARYSNGSFASLSSGEFVCSTVDTSAPGEVTLTVTLADNDDIKGTAKITVLGISKISINSASVGQKLAIGGTINTGAVELSILCSDGSTVVRKAQSVDTSALDNTKEGIYTITASYNGFTSDDYTVYVVEANSNYSVFDAELPASISGLDSKKDQFINKGYGYVVGDDNPFILKLQVVALDENGDLVDYDFSDVSFVSYFELYLDGKQLTGDELAKYASFNGAKHSIQFTPDAVGKKFTIKVAPEGLESAMKSLYVEVVDGYNIYEAWELNYLTNMDEEYAPFGSHIEAVDNFLAPKGVTRPTNLGAIVLHNDLIIQRDDIPSQYYIDNNNSKDGESELWDKITIFPHANDAPDGKFEFYGNYYTIQSYPLPTVCKLGTGNQSSVETLTGVAVSNAQLFRFSSAAGEAEYWKDIQSDADITFKPTDYKTTLHSLYVRDDNPNNNEEWKTDRAMRGLIAMKVCYGEVSLENTVVEAFYISFYLDYDYVIANVNESVFYNSYQNHIYIFNKNLLLDNVDALPGENHVPATLNITKSKITKSGGPVILTQTGEPKQTRNSNSGNSVNISKDTEIWTLVTGTETWFVAMGQTSTVVDIIKLNEGLYKNFGNSFVSDVGERENLTGKYVNLIMASLDADLLGQDVDGTFSIVDGENKTTYLDMNDTCGNYGNPYVEAYFGISQGQAPILSTYTGGTLMVTGETSFVYENYQNLADGDYIALYQKGMGVVLGLNGANNAIPRLPVPETAE